MTKSNLLELKPLTAKQQLIYEYIKKHISELGYSPTSNDIKEEFGFQSANGAYEHLNWIEKKGYIKRTPYVARSIVVL